MTLHVANVLSLLSKKFLISNSDPPPRISRQDTKMADHIYNILYHAIGGKVEVEELEEIDDEEDSEWEKEEFKAFDDYVLPSHKELKFGERIVTREEVEKAIKFYRRTSNGSRTLKTMKSQFRWLTSSNHLVKLRKYEKERDNMRESRTELLRLLGKRLFEEVKEKLEKGLSMHDRDLMYIARDINRKEMRIDNFTASQTWITRWKQSYGIVSRRITKFTSTKCLRNKPDIQKKADDFVSDCRKEMKNYLSCQIFNADQCGVQKELYGARSLAFVGERTVERVVQSKSSLTHSFTFLPLLFMDGSLGPKAFVVLPEPSGHFPPTRPIPNCPNLEVRAAKSHIMSKDLMCDWLRSCVFHPSAPKKMLAIVDSWPSFKDHATIKSCAPPGFDVVIKNIPPHTTGIIQPLDVHWNGPFKNLIKKFSNFALNFHPEYVLAQRNNTILMISLLYFQISSIKFCPFLQYSWKKAGYMDTSSPFLTPSEFCFGQVGADDCFKTGCTENAFIKCARCTNTICFSHFIIVDRHYCPYL